MVTRCRPLPPRLSNPNSGNPSDERPGKLTAPDFETDCGSSQLAITAIQLGTARINFGGDNAGIGEIGAFFEAFVFEPEPSCWGASETDGRVERPIERE